MYNLHSVIWIGKMNPDTHYNNLPTFNLKAVVQETGLKQDTLRAWERRYGLPQPDRTSGGHRLYSQRDIDTLKWLVARQNEGLSISRAVDLWHRLESEGADPLQEQQPTGLTLDVAPVSLSGTGNNLDTLRQNWINACLNFDEKLAEQLLTQAAALFSPEMVCIEFLQRGLAEIGQKWIDGQISVQQEHFASGLAVRRLEALIAGSPNPTRPGRILIACPPEELHVFSLLLVTFLLRRNGWETVFLGANVPVSHLEETIKAVKPNLVVLAAQQIYTAGTLLNTTEILKKTGVPVAYGGAIFNKIPALRDRIPAYFLGEHLEQTAHMVKQVMGNMVAAPGTFPVSAAYKAALAHYREKQPLIESVIWQAVDAGEFPQATLSYWNFVTSRNIIGGLTLGSLSFLNQDWSWTRDMLLNHNQSQQALNRYLAIYFKAAVTHLDDRGKPVVEWFAQFADF
jgi:methanogenic corrinoid protein MtbC1